MSALSDGLAVVVRAPASSANLGPGFDALGLGLGLWDEYEVTVTGDRLVVDVEGEGAEATPRDETHLVYRCIAAGLREQGVAVPRGLHLRCRNGVPHGRGMGSSATAAVAGFAVASALVALDRTGRPDIDRGLVNDLAAEKEGHPDNSSASVYGGLTISWCDTAPAITPVCTTVVETHPDVDPVLLVPSTQLPTVTARAALPAEVSLRTASLDAGRAALLVEALTRRPELLLPATRDFLHQEQRRSAYPGTMALVDTLRAAGLAAVVSGAGPTVLVLTTVAADAGTWPVPEGWRIVRPGIAPHGVVADLAPVRRAPAGDIPDARSTR